MPNLTPVDEFSEPATVAEDGEDADSASLEEMFQWVVNRTHWLRRRLFGIGDFEQSLTIPLLPILGEADDFSGFVPKLDGDGAITLRQVDSDGTRRGWIAIGPLIALSHLVRLGVTVRGRGGHSSVPATPPQLRLYEMTPDARTVLAEVSDTESPVLSYEADHELILEPASPVNIQSSRAYYLRLVGESGAGSVEDGWEVISVRAYVTG